jgi:hypothetical protein
MASAARASGRARKSRALHGAGPAFAGRAQADVGRERIENYSDSDGIGLSAFRQAEPAISAASCVG